MIKRILINLFLVGIFMTPAQALADWKDNLNDNLAEQARLQGLINDAKNQENTLSNQISLYNNQIALTQLQISSKQASLDSLNGQITDLTNQINTLQKHIDDLTHTTVERFKVNQAVQAANPSNLPISSGNYADEFSNLAYQSYILYKDNQFFKQMIQLKSDLTAKESDLSKDRDQVQAQRDSLASSNDQLNNQKIGQQQLLAQTQGSEGVYQNQLKQAKAAADALLSFARARTGSSSFVLGSPEIASDGWGTYYNQRDPRWGKILVANAQGLGGDGTIAEMGCLITSVAMVWTHYGAYTNPGTIGLTPSYFEPPYGAMYLGAAAPPGHSVQYVSGPSDSAIINHLSAGPVIIGMSLGDQTHWVVVRGSSGGEMYINDPWEPYAMNVPLSAKYGGWSIFAARFYQ